MTTVPTKPTNLAKARPLTSNIAKRKRGTLVGVSDIRRFFHRNTEPIYFISATNFNLVGIDEWVGNFTYINYIDCYDGQHPNVFVPTERPHEPFESIEDINNYLLRHPDVKSLIKKRGEDYQKSGGKGNGKAVFLMFDETTEKLCKDLGLEVCFPPAALRTQVDDKMETTRIGNRARVRSVPNKLCQVRDYEHLCKQAGKNLGNDLVIQTAYGDSGHTTFFVKNEEDFAKHEGEITSAPEVKIMKRIRCRGSALEACVTRHGTIVGPLMTELVGFPDLTPYKGGWCGNEVFAGAFDRRIRKNARRAAMAFGDQLREMGYLGYFEIDFLTDLDDGTVYLGECNPRITGASSMTNLAAFAHADAPLFLFHLLEWMGVKYELDVDELNDRWADPDNIDSWSQLVIKHTKDTVDRITHAPPSGIYELDNKGQMHYVRMQTHRRTVRFENRAFFMRIAGLGDYRYEGADLGILVSPGRFMDDDFQLTKRAKQWIKGIRGYYAGESDAAAQPELTGFKLL